MRLQLRFVGIVAPLCLLGVSLPLNAQQSFNPPPSSLNAANALLALPWPEQVNEHLKSTRNAISNMGGKKFVDASGNGWEFSLGLENLRLETNAPSLAPGFVQGVGGFMVRAPLNGSWSFGIAGDLKAHAWAGTQTTAFGETLKTTLLAQDVIVPFALGIDDITVSASAGIDATDPTHPKLVGAIVQAHARIAGSAIFPGFPVDLDLSRQADGSLLGQMDLTRELGFPDFLAVDEGVRLIFKLLPFSTKDTWFLVVALEGAFYLQFPDPIGRVSIPSSPFFTMPLALPANQIVGGLIAAQIAMARGSIPLPWPPPGSAPAPSEAFQTALSAPVDFATPRDTIESGLAATHVPYGAVLSIDYPVPPPVLGPPHQKSNQPYTYGVDADSTIWTGHYIAAEAFRYAVTHSDDALAKVKSAISGLETDFKVTKDAALQDGKYVVVPSDEAGSIFARSVMLHSKTAGADLPDWTYSVDTRIATGQCLYVMPTGGWSVGSKRTFPTYEAALKFSAGTFPKQMPQPVDKPGKPIQYGSGCGNRGEDSPISRDQYSGILMGLAYAYALVPGVQDRARTLIDTALDFVLTHNWNVPLPPDGTMLTTFLGNFDAQLSLLRIGATVDPSHVPPQTSQGYQQLYNRFAPASALCWLPEWLSTIDVLDMYFKYNLSHAFEGPLLYLETDATLRANYLTDYNILRGATANHRNAYFGLVDILTGAATSSSPSASNPGHLLLGEEIKSDLADWVTRWKATKGSNGMPLNATSDSAAAHLASLWPTYVSLYTNLAGDSNWEGTYPLPLQYRLGNGMEFVWQMPPAEAGIDPPGSHRIAAAPSGVVEPPGTPKKFDCSTTPPTSAQIGVCSSEASQEGPGVDYLLAYWLGVYLNVLPPN